MGKVVSEMEADCAAASGMWRGASSDMPLAIALWCANRCTSVAAGKLAGLMGAC